MITHFMIAFVILGNHAIKYVHGCRTAYSNDPMHVAQGSLAGWVLESVRVWISETPLERAQRGHICYSKPKLSIAWRKAGAWGNLEGGLHGLPESLCEVTRTVPFPKGTEKQILVTVNQWSMGEQMFAGCISAEWAGFPGIGGSSRYLGNRYLGEETHKLSIAMLQDWIKKKTRFVPLTKNSPSSRCETSSQRPGSCQRFGAICTWADVRKTVNTLFTHEHSRVSWSTPFSPFVTS